MNLVFVLDANKTPLLPCHPMRARKLLESGKAKVYKMYPFTIILNRKVDDPVEPNHELKLDPGSKVTGIAIVNKHTKKVVFGANLHHRGHIITQNLLKRRQIRRSRRNRKTRYRKARFLNRAIPKGWLPPSLLSRVDNVTTDILSEVPSDCALLVLNATNFRVLHFLCIEFGGFYVNLLDRTKFHQPLRPHNNIIHS